MIAVSILLLALFFIFSVGMAINCLDRWRPDRVNWYELDYRKAPAMFFVGATVVSGFLLAIMVGQL